MRCHLAASVSAIAALMVAQPALAQFMDLRVKPKAASVKPEGELVITRTRPTNFDAAKAAAVTEASDGDELWVALRTKKPLSSYGLAEMHAGQPDYYELQFSVRSSSDDRAYDDCFWVITPAEAARDEVILSLSPKSVRSLQTKKGWLKDASMQCWLRAVAKDEAKPGVWRNRFAFVSMNPDYRPAEIMAVSPLTANVPNGFPKWNTTYNKRCDTRALSKNGSPAVCPR